MDRDEETGRIQCKALNHELGIAKFIRIVMNIDLDHTHCLMHISKGLCLLLLLDLIVEFHHIGIQITLLYFIFDFERSYGLQFLINESF
jgi:hypothetical protein